MEIIKVINNYLLYLIGLLVIIAIIFYFIYSIKKNKVEKKLDKFNDRLNVTTDKINNCKNDIEKIEYTIDNSLPLFYKLGFGFTFIKILKDEYGKKKKNKRKNVVKKVAKELSKINKI